MKLSDFMVNSKMPAPARAGWPLLCKGEEILWVPGYQIAEPFRLKAQGTSALYVQVRNAPA
jgi:tRNA(Ile)-lysidine synthase